MAANAQPIFVKTPRNSAVKIITGVTDDDGSGATLLFTADATNGSRIHAITCTPAGTVTTTAVIRIFLKIGSTYYLLIEKDIPSYTQATGSPAPCINLLDSVYADFLDPADRFLTLGAGDALYVATYNTTEAYLHITAMGGDY